ncbi:hypothetical protein [Arthrobacter sp. efr-133-TYG-104]|uniref:hypothetical protein n=1 Tax=Arthrobacter sp. efr-133-TYG-104 TaxID=3040324 RepID=UPI002549DEEF|nr:hypothetical protein [Arthrobacter sp. efr-133-TYG-104]
MTFFDDMPESTQGSRKPRPVRPAWAGPPSNELPGVLHIGEFLHSSERMVLALKLVEVYSTGCLLDLAWTVRRRGDSDNQWREVMDQGFNHPGSRTAWDSGLMVGISYADGGRAIAAQDVPAVPGNDDVAGPVLAVLGRGGGAANDEMVQASARYWLWPLPVEADTQLVAQWEALGVPESSLTLSAEELSAALANIRTYWSE